MSDDGYGYDESVEHLLDAIQDQEWTLLSDTENPTMMIDSNGRIYRVEEWL